MRRDFLFGIGLLASVASGGGSAVAADMPVRTAPAPVVVPVVVSDWTGFYVGIHGGGGWGHTSFESTIFDLDESFGTLVPPSASPKGGVFGFQAGHNWQWGPIVGGLEIDFSGASISESTTFAFPVVAPGFLFSDDFKIDELASARFRLGYLILPNLLAYGTAGLGWGHERLSVSVSKPDLDFETRTSFFDEFGWVAGAGLEWKFYNNWLLRGEWLHYDFGKATHITLLGTGASPPLSDAVNVRTTVDVARAAISYKFGPP